ncbi:MAG: D-hexose-6-phosphate mutarotase [Burkholderiaceae bacterium]|jgi:glucose-6-phosphate 1-epimerase|nr:D-hexose-6-phosphate mutarotase [Burkholderiaceae bacterium]
MKDISHPVADSALHKASEASPLQAFHTAWQGLPAIGLRLACGDTALVALQGAQLLSWCVQGREQLFLSPRAAHDGHSPIRGGIPVCFPQFNQRGPLVKHGFARTLPWRADTARELADDGLALCLRLADTPQTQAVWPHAFEAGLQLRLQPGRLEVELTVNNRGDGPLQFTAALHSYLRVDDVEQSRLHGLQGLRYWDAVADTHPTLQGDLDFGVERDQVYPRPARSVELRTPGGGLRIDQDVDWTETVVWNPGPLLCARLTDMEPEGWRQMLCVEAAAIDAPVVLAAGAQWRAAQRLRCL